MKPVELRCESETSKEKDHREQPQMKFNLQLDKHLGRIETATVDIRERRCGMNLSELLNDKYIEKSAVNALTIFHGRNSNQA